ncbi:unnamed protein product [Orchesella dallaii]|uniref:Protein phosphatase 1 regulatory subunit 21 N-terminal domain-containing protein n=1 Tax=Orchesella dallaii TaxID=48710 RepID=A0ABP1Q9K7_9HEXA
METSSSSDDQSKSLNTKYQKLAAEYAKLRSQVTVLKKGVLDEQEKNEVLKSTLTIQDQSVRKLEQELDSVKFRNRQLEKRIEILQQSPENGSKSSIPNVSVDAAVLMHVEQNKTLQESLAELQEKYSTEVGRLKRMIDQELVPRELLDSLKCEHNERVSLMNKKLVELTNMNVELMDRIQSFEQEQANKSNSERVDEKPDNELMVKLTESETCREKLLTENQILKLKLRKYGKENPEELKSPDSSIVTSPSIENMLGRMVIEQDNLDQSDLVEYLRNRIHELVKTLQLTDSKAIHYYKEAFSLCRLVKASQLNYKRVDNEFGKLKGKFKNLSDEFEDTKRNYNAQVDSLTEHIACMNDKLAGQAEEIMALKGRR